MASEVLQVMSLQEVVDWHLSDMAQLTQGTPSLWTPHLRSCVGHLAVL